MILRFVLITAVALLLAGCTTPRSSVPQGLESVARVQLQVKVPENETEAVRATLQAHVASRLREELPRLNLAGTDADWTLEVQVAWEHEYQPQPVQKPPDCWAVCRISVVKPAVVDGRQVTAVAYLGLLHPSQVVEWFPKRRSLADEHELLDRVILAFAVDWRAANAAHPPD